MILENYNPAAIASEELVESADFAGDTGEFAELTVAGLSEMHNLTIALARFEHKALTEGTDESKTLIEAAVGEFFAKAAETVKKWWASFIAWLGSMWTRMKDAFVKREEWLGRNKSAISGATAEQLKDIKASIGSEVLNTNFADVASKAINEAKAVIAAAGKTTAAEGKSFKERAQEAITKHLAKRDAKNSIGKNVHDSLIGESKEVEVNSGLVGKLISTAEATFKAVGQIGGAKMVADAAVKEAEGLAHVTGGDKADINARISALRDVGHLVQATISAHASAISTANGQVMPVLVRIAGAAGKKEKEPKAAPAAATNESGSLLDAYL
jgi:hypothetical protein